MNRLKKIAGEEYIYKFESPIIVNICDESTWKADTYTLEKGTDDENIIRDAVISDMSEMGSKGLAEYLDPKYNKVIYPYIVSIIVTVENARAITIVKANKELTSEEKDAVKDYISGQFSDGWGEGFEQQTLDEWTEEGESEEWDEEEQESYMEEYDYKVTMSASFWDSRNWYIKEI